MRDSVDPATILQAALAGVASVCGSYAIAGFTPEFVAAPIASFLTRVMPGAVVTFAITVLGDLGQKLNLLGALGIATVGLAVVSYLGIHIGRRFGGPSWRDGGALWILVATAPAVTVVTLVGTGALRPSVAAGVAAGVVAGIGEANGVPLTNAGPARRRLLRSVAGLAGVGALAGYLGPRQGGSSGEDTSNPSETTPADVMNRQEVVDEVSTRLDAADAKSLDVAGIEPLVSEDFYEVDINSVNPDPDATGWSLRITGAVETEHTYNFDDLVSMTPQHQFSTLRCVGEALNGQKMDTALWTGVPIGTLLEQANPQGEYVMARAVDGYFNEFPIEALRTGTLAYGMNGEPLPRGHGYPVRALIPGHWGEINVKWISEIEVLTREKEGYWEKRGWHGTGPVKTVAKIKAVNRDGDSIQVGGHAYAGTRGISGVEVSTDGGDTWQTVTLSEPLPGEDVWRQWTYEYESPGSEHEVVARAIEADGTVQPKEKESSFPSGPSGWVSKTVRG